MKHQSYKTQIPPACRQGKDHRSHLPAGKARIIDRKIQVTKHKPTIYDPRSMIHDTRGLTFIELIVVLSIISVIAGVILFRFSDFSNNISLQNLSQDIALHIKEAQTSAISGKLSDGFGSGNPPVYGVFFDIDDNDTLVLFRDLDTPPNYVMDGNCNKVAKVGIECLAITTITTADRISDLCDNTGECGYKKLYIAFERPYPDPVTSAKKGGDDYMFSGGGQVEIVSANETYKHIIVWPTGQISVRDGRAEDLDGCGTVGDPCELDDDQEE